jgi:hypothetical protein
MHPSLDIFLGKTALHIVSLSHVYHELVEGMIMHIVSSGKASDIWMA